MTGGPDFVLLHVSNIEESVKFYTEKLGMELDGEATPGFAQFKQGEGKGAALALSLEEATPTSATELWWFVSDIDATHEKLSLKGVEIASPIETMPFGRTFSVKAPANHTLFMLQLPAA